MTPLDSKPFRVLIVLVYLSLPLSSLAKSKFEPLDQNTWKKALFSWDSSPVDLSFLNHKPAGKFGPVRAAGDKLIFANGNEARFWGVNIQAHALFNTDDKHIARHAKRLARLGINLVRIHHHDSHWVKPNVFVSTTNHTRTLQASSMRKIDQWITALRNEGIYIWLDLHVGRKLRPGDHIYAYEETKGDISAYGYLNRSIQTRMIEFQENYLNHTNVLTGIKYKDDPAIMGVLITNENTLSHNGGNRYLTNKNAPKHNALFNSDRLAMTQRTGLSYEKTYNTWLPGESKIYLSDVEHRFNQSMISSLHRLGVSTLIATNNLWNTPAYTLPSLTDGDLIDTHAYGQGNALKKDPRKQHNFLAPIALGAIAGKPVTISEWNVQSDGVRDRFYMPLYTAAISSFQGWDAAMLYGYSQVPLNTSTQVRNWSSYNDPALMGMMPAAALLYRQRHVAQAKKNYLLKLNRQTLFYQQTTAASSKTIRTLLEQHRLTIGLPQIKELPWLTATPAVNAAVETEDIDKDFLPADQQFVESDTKELKRHWGLGIHMINSRQTQSATGWIGGKKIKLDHVQLSIDTKNALVSIQSLTEMPITLAKSILITLCAQVNERVAGKTPFWSEPVTGTINIRSSPGKYLYALDSSGNKQKLSSMQYTEGRYLIELTEDDFSHWLLLE